MKIKKDSLLLRIVFYNDIAIILTSILITMVLIFITFTDMEDRVIDMARDKIVLLSRGYQGHLDKMRDDLFEVSRGTEYENSYQATAETIKEELDKKSFKNYYDVVVTIISDNGTILGEAGNKNSANTLSEKNTKILLKNITKRDYEASGYYLTKINDEIYARIAVSYFKEHEKNYIVITVPIDFALLQSLKNFLELNHRDKIFLIVDNKFSKGDLNYSKGDTFLFNDVYNDLSLREYKYYYKNRELDDTHYYVALYSLTNYNNEYIGALGIGISKENMIKTKAMVSIFVTALVVIVIIIGSTITSKIFKKLLLPLSNIAELANKVSSGDYNVQIPVEGTGEIRTLANSVKRMLIEILSTQENLKRKNKKLHENLERIESIDRLLIGIHIEEDLSSTVKDLMSAFTSEIGLAYSRAMFFRYSRERDCLVGEFTSINRAIKDEKDDILREKESCNGFKFQINELNELVTFMKIPFKNNNLLSQSLIERKILYYNDKGYKYDLGNDLLKSIGLNNFLIFPIYNENRYSGVILIDYYTRDRKISLEEVELLNLLSMNLSVRMQNKVLEEDRIDKERAITVEKLAERFLKMRENTIDKIVELSNSNISAEVLKMELQKLKPELEKIQKENDTLKTYSKLQKSEFKEIVLDNLLQEIVDEVKSKIERQKIALSLFSNYSGQILGDPITLKKVFLELIDNACKALENSQQENKKINITVFKDRKVKKIKIEISDNGIGMTPIQLKNIYEPFISYRDDNTPGLGLSFVFRTIKEHVGVIKFFSKYNEGTNVKITLNTYKEENL